MRKFLKKNIRFTNMNLRAKKAFTLIEILAVIIIIGIVTLVVVPITSNYIFGTRESVYEKHENSMKEAAQNMTTECLYENDVTCKVPTGGGSRRVYLGELIEDGYLESIKDPKSDSYCDEELSYVVIKKTDTTNYDYDVCLVCSEYASNLESCTLVSDDKPTCGKISTNTSSYTNTTQTITVECIDDLAGCTKRNFSKVFTSEAEEKTITIKDNNNVEVSCKVESAFLLDQTKPLCTLKAEGDVFESGIYYGPVKVVLSDKKDVKGPSGKLSGLDTYGMGITDRVMYDKTTTLNMDFGTTTVTGYVKDKAGNENTCTLTVKRNPDYNLIYNDNDGTGCSSVSQKIIYKHNYNVYGNLCTPTRTGYTFAGWYTAKTGGTRVKNTTKMNNKRDTTIYAHWTANTYTIEFNANTGSGTMSSITCTYDQDCTLTSNGFTKTGYTFAGWAISSSGAKVYNNGATVKNLVESGTYTLYAKWTANKYTVTFNKQSGSGGTNSVTATYNSAMPSASAPTRTGYTFGGYYTSTGGSGTQYYNSSMGSVRKWNIASNTTLYAKWETNSYTIEFNGNGNTGGSTKNTTCTYDKNCTLNANGFTKTGYLFQGWATSSDGGVLYENSATVKNLVASGTITLYAKWKANTYTVNFNGNGNTGGSTALQTCTIDVNCALNANGFSRENYIFIGWATSSDGEVSYDNSATVKNIASGGGNITLYAKWIATIIDYKYTGNVQTFTAYFPGKYKLEVWGAQGGNTQHSTGGKGGSASGYVNLTKGQVLYVIVGGGGVLNGTGGYNGGGNSKRTGNTDYGSGGGATHISKTDTLLSNTSVENLYLVAGGGGGAGDLNGEDGRYHNGGSGGGTNGGNGNAGGTGASQSSGGNSYDQAGNVHSGYGRGASTTTGYGPGGGGGYYGGGAAEAFGSSGGGGSGYVGGVSSGSMSNGVRSGDGYAIITFIE